MLRVKGKSSKVEYIFSSHLPEGEMLLLPGLGGLVSWGGVGIGRKWWLGGEIGK